MGTQQQVDVEKEDRNNNNNKSWIYTLLICTLVFMITTIVLGVLYGQQVGSNISDDVCQSPGCIRAANRILGSMNGSVDPCDDFYQYSCGKWIDDHVITESQPYVTLFSDLSDTLLRSLQFVLEEAAKSDEAESIVKARNFYRACMNTDEIERLGIEPAKQLIATMGGWPILGDEMDNSTMSFEVKLATFNTLHRTWAILHPIVDVDTKSSMDRIIQIHEPPLGLPDRGYYTEVESINKTIAYRKYIVNFLTALSNETTPTKIEEFKTFAAQVVELERRLAENSLSRTEYREAITKYHRRSLNNITSDVNPSFDWITYISKVMEIADDPDIVVDGDTEIIMNAMAYVTNFTDVIMKYDRTFIHNYLVFMAMDAKYFFFPQILRDAMKPLTKELYGTTAEEPRWKLCSAATESYFSMPVGSLFVQSYFPPENKAATEVMVEQIRSAFKTNLEDIDWMDEVTKDKAREKADMITEMIAYPDYIIDDQGRMDENYRNTSITPDRFLQNAVNLGLQMSRSEYGSLNKKVDRNQWYQGPAVVNAFYSPSRNQIFFPAGILQPPFYDQYQPTAMNYGGIGMVIGHEITHGFDDSGADFNGEGNMLNWWTEYSKSGFDEKSKCLSDQYSRESWKLASDTKLDGQLTLGENIADNGGIRESFMAFREWQKSGDKDVSLPGLQGFTDEQLFFLGFAQVWCGKYTKESASLQLKGNSHSPGEFRVKVPGMNYEEFGKAYNCEYGVDTMYPSSGTCRVW